MISSKLQVASSKLQDYNVLSSPKIDRTIINFKLATCYLLLATLFKFAQSKADFLSKYSIALKEASECRYWIEIMIETKIVQESKFREMLPELNEIIKILISTTKKLKEKK